MSVWYREGLYEKALIYNGVSKIFGIDGRLVSENGGLVPKYTNGAVRVGVLSLLQVGSSKPEVGIEVEVFKKYRQDKTLVDLMNMLMCSRNFIGMFKRTGSRSNLSYTQVLFVYPVDFDILGFLLNAGISLMEV